MMLENCRVAMRGTARVLVAGMPETFEPRVVSSTSFVRAASPLLGRGGHTGAAGVLVVSNSRSASDPRQSCVRLAARRSVRGRAGGSLRGRVPVLRCRASRGVAGRGRSLASIIELGEAGRAVWAEMRAGVHQLPVPVGQHPAERAQDRLAAPAVRRAAAACDACGFQHPTEEGGDKVQREGDAAALIEMVPERAASDGPLVLLGTAVAVAAGVGAAAEAVVDQYVTAARAARLSWSAIGDRLGVSKEAVRHRRRTGRGQPLRAAALRPLSPAHPTRLPPRCPTARGDHPNQDHHDHHST